MVQSALSARAIAKICEPNAAQNIRHDMSTLSAMCGGTLSAMRGGTLSEIFGTFGPIIGVIYKAAKVLADHRADKSNEKTAKV
jgi:hypothetical protein